MSVHTIAYQNTGYFSQLICDYLTEKEMMDPFFGNFPRIENFEQQIKLKEATFSHDIRKKLAERLLVQYQNIAISQPTLSNIDLLREKNTFTITTGHQLNLFTGPLYFLYKIFSVINLSESLKKKYPKFNFVPVYWMATEDHDFEEINYFNLFGKKVAWNRESGGAVGELSTEGLSEVLKDLERDLGKSDNAKKLITLFSEAYTKHQNLAEATRFLANELFAEHGLVILDGNDHELKKEFIPYAAKDITKNLSFQQVNKTTEQLTSLGYQEQVHARKINLFYLDNSIRERIIEKEGVYYVNDTELSFTEGEILKLLKEEPQKFSPNALLRPLFQEVILPNLCYVGGGGELAYWFQLKDYFKAVNVTFPILLLRNSVLLVPAKFSEKLDKMNVEIDSLFLKENELRSAYTKQISSIKIDFTSQKKHLQKQFKDLFDLAKNTDASFVGAVAAQEKKQLNGLDHLEKRLLKAQKRKLSEELKRLTNIQQQLFPKQSLQERTINFSEFYLEYGDTLFSELKANLDPLANQFTILELKLK